MKTATLPSLRVDPDLRDAVESVLGQGETLSSFVEQSVRAQIALRRHRADFIGRGLAAGEQAARSGRYVPADVVLERLGAQLEAARRTPRG